MDINSLYNNIDVSSITIYIAIGGAIIWVILSLLKDVLVEKDIKFGNMTEREAILKHKDDFKILKRKKSDDEDGEFFSITEDDYERALEKAEADDEAGYSYEEDDDKPETSDTLESIQETVKDKKPSFRDSRSRQRAHSRYRGRV
jgi:hypothetical protein